MTDIVKIRDIILDETKYIGRDVTIKGWVKTARIQKNIAFLKITDGSCLQTLQIVAPSFPKEVMTGVSVHTFGQIMGSPAQGQSIELHPRFFTVIGECKEPDAYPMAKKKHSMEHLRSFPHLRPRTDLFQAIFRVRNAMIKATHDFFQDRGFQNVHTPLITSSDCEGAGEAFHVMDGGELKDRSAPPAGYCKVVKTEDRGKTSSKFVFEEPSGKFFKKDAYLTVSGQLHVEAFACSMGDVYTFGPTFRAEKSQTSRHLAEFWMIEPELVFIEFDQLLDCAEEYVRYCVSKALKMKDEMMILDKEMPGLIQMLRDSFSESFSRITYTDAIAKLTKQFGETDDIRWGMDLSSDYEKWLVKEAGGPLIVTKYPKSLKPFYMLESDSKDSPEIKTVDCFDVLVPGVGELIGGSMREHDYDKLLTAMVKAKMDLDTYSWYLDLRKYGTVPHGGFGLGFERLLMLVTGQQVRDTVPFPVAYKRLD
jgi:asparaginyl-tRNA synthetase